MVLQRSLIILMLWCIIALSLLFCFSFMSCTEDSEDSVDIPEIFDIGPEIDPAEFTPGWHDALTRSWGMVRGNEKTLFVWNEGYGTDYNPAQVYATFVDDSDGNLAFSRTLLFESALITVPLLMRYEDSTWLIFYGQYDGGNIPYNCILELHQLVLDEELQILENRHLQTIHRPTQIWQEFSYQIPNNAIGPVLRWIGDCYLLLWREDRREPDHTYSNGAIMGYRLTAEGEEISPGVFAIMVPENTEAWFDWRFATIETDVARSLLLWTDYDIEARRTKIRGFIIDDDGLKVDNSDLVISMDEPFLDVDCAADDATFLLTMQGTLHDYGVFVSPTGQVDDDGLFIIGESSQQSYQDRTHGVFSDNHGFVTIYQSGKDVFAQFITEETGVTGECKLYTANSMYSPDNVLNIINEGNQYRFLHQPVGLVYYYYNYAFQFRTFTFTEAGNVSGEKILAACRNETTDPALCFTDDRAIVLWTDDRDYFPDETDLFCQFLDSDGRPLSEPNIELSSYPGEEHNSKLTSNGDSCLLTFSKISRGGHYYFYENIAVFYDNTMDVLCTERFEGYSFQTSIGPWDVATDGNRYLLVTALDDDLVAYWIEADGTRSEFPIHLQSHETTNDFMSYVTLTCVADKFLVTYADSQTIWGRIIDQQGTVSEPINLIEKPWIPHSDNFSVSGGDQYFLLCWMKTDSEDKHQSHIVIRRFDQNGVPIDNDKIELLQRPHAEKPVCAWNGRYFMILWQEDDEYSGNNSTALNGVRLLENGILIDEMPIHLHSFELDDIPHNTTITATPSGDFILAYDQNNYDFISQFRRVALRKITTR